jgi:nucleotide-binding universal stress UspA family protein
MIPAITRPVHYPTRILCPTDFSDCSRRALEYAIALARPVRAEITLLHVLLLPLPSIDSDDEPDWMPPGQSAASELLEQMRCFAKPALAAGLTIRTVLRDGLPGDEIVRSALSIDTDLIVMGSHGHRGLDRLLGSHAEHVLRTAPFPVLVVRSSVDTVPGDAPFQLHEVLCAASGSEHSPQTVDYAECLAAGAGAHLTLLHVTEPGHLGARPAPWGDRIEASPSRFDWRISLGSPRSEILRCAEDHGADLIVMGAHDRGPGIFGCLGSTAGYVVRAAGCGVLTVKAMPLAANPEPSSEDHIPAEVGAGGKR